MFIKKKIILLISIMLCFVVVLLLVARFVFFFYFSSGAYRARLAHPAIRPPRFDSSTRIQNHQGQTLNPFPLKDDLQRRRRRRDNCGGNVPALPLARLPTDTSGAVLRVGSAA